MTGRQRVERARVKRAGTFGRWIALAGLALSACTPAGPVGPVAPPTAPGDPTALVEPSPASAAAAIYYAQIQQALLREGLLRTDPGREVPLTADMLAVNFLRIALFDEYRRGDAGLVQEETESRLRRWEVPVRIGLRFGASVPPDQQATDRANLANLVAHLASVTGHPITLDDASPNFLVHILAEDERQALGPKVRAAMPNLTAGDIAGITQMPPTTYCLVYALSSGNSGAYTRAFAVIRAEHPDLMRLSCLHEEIAQGLGLANDSPRARPSVFNDDEEFALLTWQDDLLLRMLYAPELSPGLYVDEARPIVISLARRLLGGDT